jgi:hypothetical protein
MLFIIGGQTTAHAVGGCVNVTAPIGNENAVSSSEVKPLA